MTRHRTAAALGSLLAAVLLAGCATIPTSGPVQQNTAPAVATGNDPAVVYLPNKPADGADVQSIVSGFVLAASAGSPFTVAKQFLTPEFAAKWDPDAGAYVHTDSWKPTKTAADRVDLNVPVIGRVDRDGTFKPVASSPVAPNQPLHFRLQKVHGQWRISDGPAGVIVPQQVFLQRIYSPVKLQFWDPGYRRFVPDLRWFPSNQVQVQAPAVVRALIAGQAAPLRAVTVSAFPGGTTLHGPVTVAGGRTAVDIDVPGAQPNRQATDRMQQQIAASLPLQVSSSSIRLTVNGRLAPVSQAADLQQPATQDPVVVAEGRFGTLSPAGVRDDTALGAKIVALKPKAVTVSARQRLAAVLGGSGVSLVTRDGRTRLIDPRRDLVPPTVDQQGWTFSVPADDPSGLRAFSVDGKPGVDLSGDLGGSAVRSIEVSTDGTRMLVLVQTDTGPSAYVAGIERDQDGTPVRLTGDHFPISVPATGATDATWVDQTTVAVLTAPLQNVVVQGVGGISLSLGSLSNARSIVGATSQTDLRALDQAGNLLQRPTNVWQPEFATSVGVDVLAVQR